MSLADLFRNPKEALEYFEYVLTQPNTYERHFSGHKVVFNYAAPNSVFSCWEHYGSNGKVIKTSDDEAKLGVYLRQFHNEQGDGMLVQGRLKI
jgi:hypothetical protein